MFTGELKLRGTIDLSSANKDADKFAIRLAKLAELAGKTRLLGGKVAADKLTEVLPTISSNEIRARITALKTALASFKMKPFERLRVGQGRHERLASSQEAAIITALGFDPRDPRLKRAIARELEILEKYSLGKLKEHLFRMAKAQAAIRAQIAPSITRTARYQGTLRTSLEQEREESAKRVHYERLWAQATRYEPEQISKRAVIAQERRITGRQAVIAAGLAQDPAVARANRESLRKLDAQLKLLNTSTHANAKATDTMSSAWLRFRHQGVWRFISSVRNSLLLLTFSFAALFRVMNRSIEAFKMYENALAGLSSIAIKTGQPLAETKQAAIDLARDGLMTVAEASVSLKNLFAAGFNLPEAIKLMKGFKDSAAFARQASLGFGEAIVGATEGLKNNNPILMDNAGLTKNMSVILKEVGVSTEEFARIADDASIRQRVLGGLLKELALFGGDAKRMLDTYSGSLARLRAQNLSTAIAVGQVLQPALKVLNDTFMRLSKKVQEVFKEFKPELIASLKTALGGVANVIEVIATGFIAMERGLAGISKFLGSNLAGGAIALFGAGMLQKVVFGPAIGGLKQSKESVEALEKSLAAVREEHKRVTAQGEKYFGQLALITRREEKQVATTIAGYKKLGRVQQQIYLSRITESKELDAKTKKMFVDATKGAKGFDLSLKGIRTTMHSVKIAAMAMGTAIKTAIKSMLPMIAAMLAINWAIGFVIRLFERKNELIERNKEREEELHNREKEWRSESIVKAEEELSWAIKMNATLEERIRLETELAKRKLSAEMQKFPEITVVPAVEAVERREEAYYGAYGPRGKITIPGRPGRPEIAVPEFEVMREGIRRGKELVPYENIEGLKRLINELERLKVIIDDLEQEEFLKGTFPKTDFGPARKAVEDQIKIVERSVEELGGIGVIKNLRELQGDVLNVFSEERKKLYETISLQDKKGFDLINTEIEIAVEDMREKLMKAAKLENLPAVLTKDQQDLVDFIEFTLSSYASILEEAKLGEVVVELKGKLKGFQEVIETADMTPFEKAMYTVRKELEAFGITAENASVNGVEFYQSIINAAKEATTATANAVIKKEIQELSLQYKALTSEVEENVDISQKMAEMEANNVDPALRNTITTLMKATSVMRRVTEAQKDMKEFWEELARSDALREFEKQVDRLSKGQRIALLDELKMQLKEANAEMDAFRAKPIQFVSEADTKYIEKLRDEIKLLQEQIKSLGGTVAEDKDKIGELLTALGSGFTHFATSLNEVGSVLAEVWQGIPKQVQEATDETNNLLAAGEITYEEHSRRMEQIEHQALLARQAAWVDFADQVIFQTIRTILVEIQAARIKAVLAKGGGFFGMLPGIGTVFALGAAIAATGLMSGLMKGANPGAQIGATRGGGSGTSRAAANRTATAGISAPIQNLSIFPTLVISADHDIFIGSGSAQEFSDVIGTNMIGMMQDAITTGELKFAVK